MKDFNDFRQFMKQNGQAIHEDIVHSVNKSVEEMNFSDDEIGMEHETYRRAWVEIGIMRVLEQYHNWVNS